MEMLPNKITQRRWECAVCDLRRLHKFLTMKGDLCDLVKRVWMDDTWYREDELYDCAWMHDSGRLIMHSRLLGKSKMCMTLSTLLYGVNQRYTVFFVTVLT